MGFLVGAYAEFDDPGFSLPGSISAMCLFLIILSSFSLEIANWLELILILTGLAVISELSATRQGAPAPADRRGDRAVPRGPARAVARRAGAALRRGRPRGGGPRDRSTPSAAADRVRAGWPTTRRWPCWRMPSSCTSTTRQADLRRHRPARERARGGREGHGPVARRAGKLPPRLGRGEGGRTRSPPSPGQALGHSGGAWEHYGRKDQESVALLEEALERLPPEEIAVAGRGARAARGAPVLRGGRRGAGPGHGHEGGGHGACHGRSGRHGRGADRRPNSPAGFRAGRRTAWRSPTSWSG